MIPIVHQRLVQNLLLKVLENHLLIKKNKLLIASARAGNVLGGGDWTNDRIFKDIAIAISKNKKLFLRNPNSVRPWQHVLEPLSGYLLLGQLLFQDKKEYAKPWNFGPSLSSNITVRELVDIVKNKWKHIEVEYESPKNEETKHLILDSSKAYNKLKWKPVWGIDSTINYTIDWYKNYYEKNIVKTEEQINKFTQDAVKIKSFGHNMLIKENQLKDVFEINSIPKTDNRGSFSRFFCKKTLSELSKNINIVQINSSYSKTAGTVRGLHFQSFPSQESKFVRCIKGKIFDVIVDIRKESKTFGKWQSIILGL